MHDYGLTDQQRMIRDSVRDLARERFAPGAAAADRNTEPPIANVKTLAKLGYTGMFMPAEYGGSGLGLFENVLVVEQLARYCANTAMLLSCTDGATPRALLALGSEEQKKTYLPRIVRGEMMTAWSMSEANAGSDVGNVQTRAVRGD